MLSEIYAKELGNQIKSNRSLIYITTHEEHRVNDVIQKISCTRSKPWSLIFWDIASGGMSNSDNFKFTNDMDQTSVLTWFSELIIEKDDFCILVLHDFYKFLAPDGHPGQAEIVTIRALKNLIEKCHTERKCVIITGAKFFMPIEFEKLVCLIDWPLPESDIIKEKVQSLLAQVPKKPELKEFKVEYGPKELEDVISSFKGLSLREVEMICTYSMITEKNFDPRKIASKKRDIIKQSGILEWIDLDFGLNEVGGLSNLKKWLFKRKNAFSESAKNYGLPNPKGLLIIGIQGAGKCFRQGTKVVMYDGSTKCVEDVNAGDILIGPDSKPRLVLNLSEGVGKMYEVSPEQGEKFYVTGNHILNLKITYSNEIINISVEDFLKNKDKNDYLIHRAKVNFKHKEIFNDPYLFGVSLNIHSDELRIPPELLSNTDEIRLNLLAGIIDTWGIVSNTGYKLIFKNKALCEEVLFLSRSLGFLSNCVLNECAYNVEISGEISAIPSKKYLTDRNKDVRTSKFTISELNEEKFYGFEVDKDHLFLLDDFTVVHNSRISKAIASFWNLPLLRLDVGRIFSGIVGSSEENLRSVIKTAESVAPCIMWVDEIDKAFASVSMASDSGTSSRIFGTFLTWMQEKKAQVFVVATANDVSNLPPELMRKGRFDDIFFVDLPDDEERKEIFKIHLTQRNFDPSDFCLPDLIKESKGFTGAEIEAAIVSAMYEGFSDNERQINTVDIIKELKVSVPIYVTMKEKIESIRNWAATRARNASNSKEIVVLNDYVLKKEDEELL